jgi:S-formylglutathione hydrolase
MPMHPFGSCPWGEKAFSGYLGSSAAGERHDATLLVKSYMGPPLKLLVDQASDQEGSTITLQLED